MNVPRETQALIRALIAFANWPEVTSSKQDAPPRITSTEEVVRVFRRLPFSWAMNWPWLQGMDPNNPEPFQKEQRHMQNWLNMIVSGEPRKMQRIVRGVNKIMGRTVRAALFLDPATQRFAYEYQLQEDAGVDKMLALGLASLFHWRLLQRVKRCPWKNCGRFRVTFPPSKPWLYCSDVHKKRSEVLRVKHWKLYGAKSTR